MKLKVRSFRINAGKPVAFIHEKDASSMDMHIGERVNVSYKKHRSISIIDVVTGFIKPKEIALSREVMRSLHVNAGDIVDVEPLPRALSSKILQKKLTCREYSKEELKIIMADIVNDALTEAEIAYFISGVSHCGMTDKEVANLTRAIFETGNKITWKSSKIADKHSIGGVAGNRTTPIVVSICAAAGVIMPKTSSRAITSAAGTADVIESIAKVNFPVEYLKKIVQKTNACLAWGGSLGLAPADDKLIQVEKTLNLDPEPQLLASILAKKLAVGSKYVLIDIPSGDGAKVSHHEAEKLRRRFLRVGKELKLKIKVVITDGSQPIGNGIGPILEIKDVLRVLKREDPPIDLEKKGIFLAGTLLEMLGKAKKGKGEKKATEILNSGLAFKKFKEIIEAQHGTINHLPEAKFSHTILAPRSGKIIHIDNKTMNYLGRLSGSPEDKTAGIYLYVHKHDEVKKDDKLMTLYSPSKYKLDEALEYYTKYRPITIV